MALTVLYCTYKTVKALSEETKEMLEELPEPGAGKLGKLDPSLYRAKRETGLDCLICFMGQNRALTVLYVPSSLDSGEARSALALPARKTETLSPKPKTINHQS